MRRTSMERLVPALLLALLLLVPAADAPARGTTVAWPDLSRAAGRVGGGEKDAAVVVGIGDYAELPDVPGATANARDWETYFVEARRVRPSRVAVLLDERAKLPLVEEAIEKARGQVERDGTLWFVFVGHGAPSRDGKEGVLVTWDAGREPRLLYDRSLGQRDLLAALGKGRQANTVVLLDACFSGQGTGTGETLARGLQPLIPTALPAVTATGAVVFTAGRGDQFAGPLPGVERPAFSYLMLGALRGWADTSEYVGNQDGKVTVAEAVGYAQDALAAVVEGRTQEPQAFGKSKDLVLAAGARETGPDLVALRRALRGDTAVAPVRPTPAFTTPSDRPAPPRSLADLPPGWVRLEPGEFWMGSPTGEPGREAYEVPHRVRLTRAFALKTTEVTQGEWKRQMGSNPSRFSSCGDECPVEAVNWYEAVEYLNRLSRSEGLEACYDVNGCGGTLGGSCQEWTEDRYCTGDYACSVVRFRGLDCRGYRLPTESEWEYAARAGTTTALYTGGISVRGDCDAPELDAIAWYCGNSAASYGGAATCNWQGMQHPAAACGTQPVARRRPNAWGLYDMLGNVSEWCGDGWGDYPAEATDPGGDEGGSDRVHRGGSWMSRPTYVRAADRRATGPAFRVDFLGFRPARSLP